jgi:hypothetical protein
MIHTDVLYSEKNDIQCFSLPDLITEVTLSHQRESSIVTTKTEQNNGITMFNISNEGTGGLGISYSSRKMRDKALNFI